MKGKNTQTGKQSPEEEIHGSALDKADTDVYDLDEADAGETDPDEWDADEDASDDAESELKPWMKAALFGALLVLAALICGVLWYFTSPGRHARGGQPDAVVQEESAQATPEGQTASAQPTPEGQAASAQPTPEGQTASTQPTPEGQAASAQPTPEGQAASAQPTPEGQTASPQPTPEGQTASVQPTPEGQTQPTADGDEKMSFEAVQENVTPKDFVNLRVMPSTQDAIKIVEQAKNGDILVRTGINEDTGWSRLEKDGEVLYAVSSYLTTDLSYVTPAKTNDPNRVGTRDGRVIVFTDCDDWVSPKEYVNLRTEPSTSEGDVTVDCQLNYGEKAHRTGYSADSGWSRLEYNGKVLYVVSSMVLVQEE